MFSTAEQSIGPINIVTATSKGPNTDLQGQVAPQRPAGPPKSQERANVVNINRETLFPSQFGRRKNKNDFYRFLLRQNLPDHLSNPNIMMQANQKVNNDILIPRSILKRNFAAPKMKKTESGFDLLAELEGFGNDQISSQEAVIGKMIDKDNKLL